MYINSSLNPLISFSLNNGGNTYDWETDQEYRRL